MIALTGGYSGFFITGAVVGLLGIASVSRIRIRACADARPPTKGPTTVTIVNETTRASSPLAERIEALLDQLTVEEKVQLLTGRDFWTTWPIEKIGLRRILMSDGPSGVRGEVWDERDPVAQPAVRHRAVRELGPGRDRQALRRRGRVEARRKGVDVVLGPTINLHRSPLGGRHFEAFSEDPVLTADLAASYVEGVQENGVAATPKHYIANDYETDRFTASTEVSDRALRELYLLAFEKAVTEAHAWAIMSSYNAINGVTASENDLLETPLNSEWGFDGIVVSDWTGVRSVDSARASQDVAMPGPNPWWSEGPLLDAVRSGDVPEADIDRKVRRILTLAAASGPSRASSRSPRSPCTSRTASPSSARPRPRAPSSCATPGSCRSTPARCPASRCSGTTPTRPAARVVAPRPSCRRTS